jgi:hypothetical protein
LIPHENSRPAPKWLWAFFVLFLPLAAWANPVILEPSSLMAFSVVAFWALVVEAGIVALLLALRGMNPMRIFIAYAVTNALVFLLVFEPLLSSEKASVPMLEGLVVALDALSIKLLTYMDALQGDDFRDVSWLRALCISAIGNSVSYFIGNIASHKPWEH